MNKLVKVFEDTIRMVESGEIQTNSTTTKHTFGEIIGDDGDKFARVYTLNSDSVSAITEQEGKTCVLNMASYKKAGGGVARGARAQEECLFRCSNLFETVSQDFYPLRDNECLYTKDAVFFKDFYYGNMEPVVADVVTIAAINLNKNSFYDDIKKEWVDGIVDKEETYENITKQKMRLMMSMAMKNGVDNLILGAWGCGVFKNQPTDMANMFYDVLIEENYVSNFKNVIFAVINDHNSVDNNYDIFHKKFN